MTTTHFNSLILQLAQRLQDERAGNAIGGSWKTYSTNLLAQYINQACRDYVKEGYKALKFKDFSKEFSEYIKLATINITGGVGSLAGNVLEPISLMYVDVILYATWFAPDRYAMLKSGFDTEDKPDSKNPMWTFMDRKIYTLGILEGQFEMITVNGHSDVTVNGDSDILINDRHDNSLLALAYTNLKTITQ